MRLLHQPDDLRQHHIPADFRRPIFECAGLVDRAAYNPGAHRLFHRNRLSRDHRLVHIGMTVDHLSIDRQPLAGANDDNVACSHLVHCQIDNLTITLDASALCLKARKLSDRIARFAAGAGLKQPADEDERDDDGGRFVIDVAGIFRQDTRREGRDQGIEIGCADTERHERIHLRRPMEKGRKAALQEAPSRSKNNRRRQQEIDVVKVLGIDHAHQPVVHRRIDMPTHLQHEERRGQHGRDDHIALQSRFVAHVLGVIMCTMLTMSRVIMLHGLCRGRWEASGFRRFDHHLALAQAAHAFDEDLAVSLDLCADDRCDGLKHALQP